ncbi:MAG: class I SAM-dependent methyltransferase [Candidatus Omnitrophota bacterium]
MCNSCQVVIDPSKKDAFAERCVGILNQSAVGLMISIGYRTGLFDTMAKLTPSTSQQIADAAGLQERYVREWLGAMVTGRIVDYDPVKKTYVLPAEHAAWLTRGNAPNNIAVTAQWIHVMAYVEDRIVESFQKGGGLRYEEYNRFHEVMAEESYQSVVSPLVEKLLPLVDGLKEQLESGIRVLDVGCGSGRALIAMARAFPRSRFTGYDFSAEAVAKARAAAHEEGLRNIDFAVQDAAAFNDKETFDVIFTFDSVHDQAKPRKMLANIHRALKPDGTYFCQDIKGSSHVEKNLDHPLAPFIYTISCTHCMSVSLAQGGEGLGAMWGKELATTLMKEAGFTSVDIKELDHDPLNYYYIVRK